MTGPRLRAALSEIPAYVPGKPPAPGAKQFKLSSNENPYPPLPGVLAAAAQAAGELNRYPDMGAVGLLEALAQRHRVPVEHLAVATGSVAVLYHLLQAACSDGDEVVYAWRSFEAYPIAVGLTGARSVRVPLAAGGRHDLPAMAAAVTDRTKVLLVCSPNNPTGPAVGRDELTALVDAVPTDVIVAIDQAYTEFSIQPGANAADAAELYRNQPNVVLLRTFSKAYGLAGLRVGFAIAPAPIAEAIRKCALPFGVSQIAQQAAIASLACEDTLLERVRALIAERGRVLDGLRDAGWDVPDSQANFVWLPLGAAAVDFAAQAASAGISVRPFAGDGCRVSIGEVEANDILLEVARAWR